MSILSDANSLLSIINPDAGVPGLCVENSSNWFFIELNGQVINRGVFKMFVGKDYCTLDMKFPLIIASIDCLTRLPIDVNSTGFYHQYFNMVHKNIWHGVVGVRTWKLCRDALPFKLKLVIMFSIVYTSWLYPLNFFLLDYLVEATWSFAGISALDPPPYKPFNTRIKAVYCQMLIRRATRLDEMVFGVNQTQNNALLETLCEKKKL